MDRIELPLRTSKCVGFEFSSCSLGCHSRANTSFLSDIQAAKMSDLGSSARYFSGAKAIVYAITPQPENLIGAIVPDCRHSPRLSGKHVRGTRGRAPLAWLDTFEIIRLITF